MYTLGTYPGHSCRPKLHFLRYISREAPFECKISSAKTLQHHLVSWLLPFDTVFRVIYDCPQCHNRHARKNNKTPHQSHHSCFSFFLTFGTITGRLGDFNRIFFMDYLQKPPHLQRPTLKWIPQEPLCRLTPRPAQVCAAFPPSTREYEKSVPWLVLHGRIFANSLLQHC